jgi:EmrB/QacA subfamily drug resistance transporter
MLSMFLAALDQTIVATALPTIGRQFRDTENLSWIITAYLLSSTAVAPVFGSLSDIYGRRVTLIASMSMFMVGSVLCAIAPNLTVLIIARGLQGLGGGGILPIVQTIISDVVSPRERGQYQAYFSAVWVAAGIGGPVIGGVFAEHLHWSMIFWINLPLGIAALAMLLPRMKRLPDYHRRRKVDWFGGVLLMVSAVIVLLVLTWGGTRLPWLSPTILAMAGAAIALAAIFIWHAMRTDEPFLPLPLLGGPVVPYAIAAGGCALSAMIALTVHLPLYYETVYRLSASEAGLALIPLVAISVPGSWLAGLTMVRVTHYKRIAILGTAIAAMTALILTIATPLPLWALLTLLSGFAFGLGTTFPVCIVAIQNAVARTQVGTATGAMNFFRALGASFVVAAFTTILLIALGQGGGTEDSTKLLGAVSGADMTEAFRYIFGAAAALMTVGSLCLVAMQERPLSGPALEAPAIPD